MCFRKYIKRQKCHIFLYCITWLFQKTLFHSVNIGTIPSFITGKKLDIWDNSLYINENSQILITQRFYISIWIKGRHIKISLADIFLSLSPPPVPPTPGHSENGYTINYLHIKLANGLFFFFKSNIWNKIHIFYVVCIFYSRQKYSGQGLNIVYGKK